MVQQQSFGLGRLGCSWLSAIVTATLCKSRTSSPDWSTLLRRLWNQDAGMIGTSYPEGVPVQNVGRQPQATQMEFLKSSTALRSERWSFVLGLGNLSQSVMHRVWMTFTHDGWRSCIVCLVGFMEVSIFTFQLWTLCCQSCRIYLLEETSKDRLDLKDSPGRGSCLRYGAVRSRY